MSSMAEGSEGWVREDEDKLDLGQDADDSQLLDHVATDLPGPSPQDSVEHDLEELEELGELDTIDNAQDQASERTVQPGDAGLPQTPPNRYTEFPGASGSIDGTSSTPDDSPSLHVSAAIGPCVNDNTLLIGDRAPLSPPKVAALWL